MRTAARLLLFHGNKEDEDEMPFLRMMWFIDGENLVRRFEETVKHLDKEEPRVRRANSGVRHRKQVYVWCDPGPEPHPYNVLRATYYTSAVADPPLMEKIEDEIGGLSFQLGVRFVAAPNRLTPCLFKRDKGQGRSKGVDVQMTVDILNHVYRKNIDGVYLFSGDGDYAPLVEEVRRAGCHVYVAAFRSGFSPKLRRIADRSIELDSKYFERIPPLHRCQEKQSKQS